MVSIVGPSGLRGFDLFLLVLAHVEQCAALRTQQPLMGVRRQGVDLRGFHVDRERSQSLDGIHQEKAVVPRAYLPYFT